MRAIFSGCFLVVFSSSVFAESTEPPIMDKRVPVATLVREDLFAGWMSDDLERHDRGMRNVEILLKERPHAKADLLAWKGSGKLFKAVLAHEASKAEEFQSLHREALDLFAEAKKISPKSVGVAATTGGSYVVFSDRLPEKHRAAGWSEAYDNYKVLWGMQGSYVSRLPEHIGGELLSGLAQSAQRTGRDEELDQYLDKIIEVLPGTPYERVAQRWKESPERAAKDNISCKTCHSAGRLEARLSKLGPLEVEEK